MLEQLDFNTAPLQVDPDAVHAGGWQDKDLLTAALEYAQKGWRIIPCNPRNRVWKGKLFEAKSPRISNWQNLGTTDAQQIRAWWQKWPDSLIGCLTGVPLGEFVLDIDLPDGPANLAALEAQYGPLPATKAQRTGSGGQQLFFLMPGGIEFKNSASEIAKSLDIRTTGGQVILPPSPHPSGGTYQWTNDLPPAKAPAWLIDLIAKPKPEPKAMPATRAKTGAGTSEYGRKALEDECEMVASTPPNTCRNNALNEAAFTLGRLVAGGEIDQAECEAALFDAAARCALSEAEARKTIHSGLTKGMKDPRSAPPRDNQKSGTNENQCSVSFEHEPEALPSKLPDVPNLSPDICPPALAPWWQDIADRAQIPMEYPAAASIVILSSLIGRNITIRPKEKDDWQVVPNLWGNVVGDPSMLKSFAVSQAAAPMKRLACMAKEEHGEAKNKWLVEQELMQVEAKKLKETYKRKMHDANERLCIQSDLEELYAKMDANKCLERRYWTADPTVEKLGELLRDNPRGMLLMRDELAGFLRSFNKQGREGDREYIMECWNGDGSVPQDRIGRGTIAGDGLCLSVIGTMQPGKLQKYVDGALAGEFDDDGLIQRFQLMVWPEMPKNWHYVDRKPDAAYRDYIFDIYQNMDALAPEMVGAVYPEYGNLAYLRFDHHAQEVFVQWFTDLQKIRRSPELKKAESFKEHLGKYNSLMPSLALIFHLVDCIARGNGGPVSYEAAVLAVEWCKFLEAHARKVYASELNLDSQPGHALAKKIQDGAVADGDAVRGIYRNQWAKLTTADDVRNGLKMLQRLHWLQVVKEGTGQNKSEVIRLHPKLVKA